MLHTKEVITFRSPPGATGFCEKHSKSVMGWPLARSTTIRNHQCHKLSLTPKHGVECSSHGAVSAVTCLGRQTCLSEANPALMGSCSNER